MVKIDDISYECEEFNNFVARILSICNITKEANDGNI